MWRSGDLWEGGRLLQVLLPGFRGQGHLHRRRMFMLKSTSAGGMMGGGERLILCIIISLKKLFTDSIVSEFIISMHFMETNIK